METVTLTCGHMVDARPYRVHGVTEMVCSKCSRGKAFTQMRLERVVTGFKDLVKVFREVGFVLKKVGTSFSLNRPRRVKEAVVFPPSEVWRYLRVARTASL